MIDHIFVSSELFYNVICCKTIDSGINLSDHIPINCVMAFNDCVNQSVDTSCNVPVLGCVTNCDGIKVIPSCTITELEKCYRI